MNFAFPIALTLAALALPIIALYILKVRLRRVAVSTNLFWKQIYEEKPPRSIWNHFRHLSSLLLQLLLLLLLVLAIADPYFSWQLLQARRIVVVIDNSASMSAADVPPSRLEAARAAARTVVTGLRFRDEMAIVVAGSTPEVAVGMTGHSPTLRDSINNIKISDNPTNLKDAIELGRQLVGQHPHGQLIVLTDGAVDLLQVAELTADEVANRSTDAPPPDNPRFDRARSTANVIPLKKGSPPPEFRIFATEANNVGITQLQVRRSLVDPLGYEILASLRNASSQAVACRLELTLDDIPIDVIPLRLKPDELWNRSLGKTSLNGGRLKAQLTQIKASDEVGGDESTANSPDGLPANSADSARRANGSDLDLLATDNSAWALLPERKTQQVLIVSPGNLFLQKAFEANPLVEVTTRKDLPAASDWPANSIVVLHGEVPPILPDGNVFVVDPTGSCDQWELSAPIENPIITDQDTTSPLMNHIRLDNVIVPEAKQLNFKSPVHALAKTLNGELIFSDLQRPNGKCLVLSINLDRSDLAFRTAFPILVANALNWFSGSSGELQVALPSGSATTVRLNQAALNSNQPFLYSPSGSSVKVETAGADGQTVTIGPLNEVGVWTIASNLTAEHTKSTQPSAESISNDVLAEVAVNLASERETDLRPLKQLTDAAHATINAVGWFSHPAWTYLIFVALVLTCLEWCLYQRRFIS